MSLRFVPPAAHPQQTTAYTGAPSAPGVHDTLRHNLSLTTPLTTKNNNTASDGTPATLRSTHPLEARLNNWRSQQDALKFSLLRRQFGLAEPVRRGMERSIVAAGEWRPACLGMSSSATGMAGSGSGGVHGDILSGRDAEIGWEDIFSGGDEFREVVDFHVEMEARLGMNW